MLAPLAKLCCFNDDAVRFLLSLFERLAGSRGTLGWVAVPVPGCGFGVEDTGCAASVRSSTRAASVSGRPTLSSLDLGSPRPLLPGGVAVSANFGCRHGTLQLLPLGQHHSLQLLEGWRYTHG